MSYATAWKRLLSIVAVLVLLLALAMHDPVAVIVSLGGLWVTTVLTLAACQHDRTGDTPLDWSQLRAVSTLAACVLVGLPSAVQISAGATVILVVLVAGTSPPVVTKVRRLTGSHTGSHTGGRTGSHADATPSPDGVTTLLELGPTPARVAELDTATLCLAWRRSFLMLSAASTTAERTLVAELRRLYLDELAHRHPGSVANWLASLPSASSGPDGFLP
jgi:hypothetical protein